MLINSKHTDLKAFEHQVVPCHPMYREKDSARGLLNQLVQGTEESRGSWGTEETIGALGSCAGLKDLKESGAIRMCDFVGIGLVLLEEVCHWGGHASWSHMCSSHTS